jgi:hypothetical protein
VLTPSAPAVRVHPAGRLGKAKLAIPEWASLALAVAVKEPLVASER